jgi:hypothetical protein
MRGVMNAMKHPSPPPPARPLSLCLVALWVALPVRLDASEFRKWTDERGREVEARIVDRNDDLVTLELRDGRKVPFPMAKLSKADREAAAEWQAEEAPAEEDLADENESKPDFSSPWPERVSFKDDPEVEVVSEDANTKEFIYASSNFRYVSDAKLSKSVVAGFARMFETTHLYCRTLPIGLNGGVKKNGKYQIRLFEEFDDYVAAGGPPTTAGSYTSDGHLVRVPFRSLGIRPVGSSYMLDRDKCNRTLPHEIVHQLTPECYYVDGAEGWFTEGIAEYVAVTPYRNATFQVRGNLREFIDTVTGYGSKDQGGRGLGHEITLPPLEKWMLQSYDSFRANPSLNYGAALLVTAYFFHLDRDGDASRIQKFLGALHDGKTGMDALEVLLDGDTFESLQEQMARAFKRQRIKLEFTGKVAGGSLLEDDE